MIIPNKPTGETMEEGSAMPAEGGEQCVPLTALAVDGTNPAEGDEAEVKARVKITRVEGDKAYIQLAEVNGEAVSNNAAPAGEGDEDMMAIAEKADAETP